MKVQVDPSHYLKGYDTKERFISYWYQINEVLKLSPKNILEIGIGNSFVSNYLTKYEIDLITLDFDKRLGPDVVASVIDIPFKNESFEIVVCYEVLEHIPFEFFQRALTEMYQIAKKFVILSLPDYSRVYRVHIEIPKYGEIRKLIRSPKQKMPEYPFCGQHYWEIGLEGYPLQKIIDNIKRIGFNVNKTYRLFEFPYHRFFILAKWLN